MQLSLNWSGRYSIFDVSNLCAIIGVNPDGTKRLFKRSSQDTFSSFTSAYADQKRDARSSNGQITATPLPGTRPIAQGGADESESGASAPACACKQGNGSRDSKEDDSNRSSA
jgi:hypothetical protein